MNEQNIVVEKKTNGFAIAGFILSIFTIVLGLIFSIIGICFVNKYKSGKGLSIAGIIISCVKLILFIVFIFIAPFILIGWMIDTFGPEFEEQVCNQLTKEQCVLNDDGSYNCYGFTCTFEEKEEKEEEQPEENIKEEKEKLDEDDYGFPEENNYWGDQLFSNNEDVLIDSILPDPYYIALYAFYPTEDNKEIFLKDFNYNLLYTIVYTKFTGKKINIDETEDYYKKYGPTAGDSTFEYIDEKEFEKAFNDLFKGEIPYKKETTSEDDFSKYKIILEFTFAENKVFIHPCTGFVSGPIKRTITETKITNEFMYITEKVMDINGTNKYQFKFKEENGKYSFVSIKKIS